MKKYPDQFTVWFNRVWIKLYNSHLQNKHYVIESASPPPFFFFLKGTKVPTKCLEQVFSIKSYVGRNPAGFPSSQVNIPGESSCLPHSNQKTCWIVEEPWSGSKPAAPHLNKSFKDVHVWHKFYFKLPKDCSREMKQNEGLAIDPVF